MSDLRRTCDTCKHNPPSKEWPCVDCDMREPADRWEPKDVGDTISRQDAIDICNNAIDLWNGQIGCGALIAVRDRISELPSAEPEIIYCKDCKYFEYDHPYIIYGVPVLEHLVCTKWGDGCRTAEDGFCFMAERRQDG